MTRRTGRKMLGGGGPILLAMLLGSLSLVSGCGDGGGGTPVRRSVVFTGPTMGTTYSVRLADLPPSLEVGVLQTGVARLLETIDWSMSTFRPDSEVSRFNASRSTEWRPVGRNTWQVVDEARRVAALSGGAFDVTVAPLVGIWGFGPEGDPGRRPTDAELEEALAHVGADRLQAREAPPALRKTRPEVQVDLSAIAKGFAVDRIGEYLEGLGIGDYLVEVGGELRARGRNARRGPWTVAIERPDAEGTTAQAVILLEDSSVASSGDYRNWFEQDGVRYSHLIDPRTGRPVSHGLASVTVVTSSTMRADALATALLVLGTEAGFSLAKRERLAALFVTRVDGGFVATGTAEFDRLMVNRRP